MGAIPEIERQILGVNSTTVMPTSMTKITSKPATTIPLNQSTIHIEIYEHPQIHVDVIEARIADAHEGEHRENIELAGNDFERLVWPLVLIGILVVGVVVFIVKTNKNDSAAGAVVA